MPADKIVLDTPRYKGEFDLDFDDPVPSALEWRWVKKISGYYPATARDGLMNSDPDFFIALACIALVRAGRVRKEDVFLVADELAELPVDGTCLRYVGAAAEEDDASPPVTAPATAAPPANTGGSSNSTSDRQAPSPNPTGAQGSAKSADYAQVT